LYATEQSRLYVIMELFEKEGYYIIKNGEYSLWCSRTDGSMDPKRGACYDLVLRITASESQDTTARQPEAVR